MREDIMPTDAGNRNPDAPLGDTIPLDLNHEMIIRLERLRVQEALNARDIAVERLAAACVSVRESTAALNTLREEKEKLRRRLHACKMEKENEDGASSAKQAQNIQADSVQEVQNRLTLLKISDDPVASVKDDVVNDNRENKQLLDKSLLVGKEDSSGLGVLRDVLNANTPIHLPAPFNVPVTPRDFDVPEPPWTPLDGERVAALPTVNTAEMIQARYAILASLPLPSNVPEDSLTPILIPPPYTLHDYIGTTSGLLRSQLGNYRVFQQSTTTWCPEREEHGYYLTPVFKCSTNPRVTTAHRWSAVDISAKLDKPTECFFNKDSKWYYAGVYISFRLEDLSTQEWECLSSETSQALIKETLAGRKNTSPQNVYETGQLYTAGALKVACIGLQCIGFNNTLYRSLLEHAALCTQLGKWRAPAGGFSAGLGIGPGSGMSWVANANAAASMPGSPVSMVGRLPGAAAVPVQPPPTLKILQHGAQDSQDISTTATSGVLTTGF